MASKIQKHAERVTRVKARIERLVEVRDSKLSFNIVCKDGYRRDVAYVTPEGHIQLSNMSLKRLTARDLATWILEMHAGYVEPPQPEKEETKP